MICKKSKTVKEYQNGKLREDLNNIVNKITSMYNSISGAKSALNPTSYIEEVNNNIAALQFLSAQLSAELEDEVYINECNKNEVTQWIVAEMKTPSKWVIQHKETGEILTITRSKKNNCFYIKKHIAYPTIMIL